VITIKDWDEFQHFKDRNPLWIKLYRKLLDNIEWHTLSGEEAKALVMLWLLASEKKGVLPSIKETAFRLRTTESKLKQTLARLSYWLIESDECLISDDLGDDIIEKRRERDREEKRKKRAWLKKFEEFWKIYPRKISKQKALDSWVKIDHDLFGNIMGSLEKQKSSHDWQKSNGQFIPHPTTWLNQKRWDDVLEIETGEPKEAHY
jgi:hypothetical protein